MCVARVMHHLHVMNSCLTASALLKSHSQAGEECEMHIEGKEAIIFLATAVWLLLGK